MKKMKAVDYIDKFKISKNIINFELLYTFSSGACFGQQNELSRLYNLRQNSSLPNWFSAPVSESYSTS